MICSIVSRSGGIAMITTIRSRRAGAAMIYSSRHCLIASFASSSASSNNNNNDKTKNNIEIDTPQKTAPTTAPARRRLRSSSSSNTGEPIPSLADFIHRAKVMKQYRKFVRLAHYVDGKDGTTTGGSSGSSVGYRAALDEVRLSYKMKMTKQLDTISKTMALTEGERKMKEISTLVGYIPVHRSSDQQPTTTNNESKTGSNSFDDDSWINIQDDEDKRGRMGVQWPWQKKKEEEVD
jgi:hypothetical protein